MDRLRIAHHCLRDPIKAALAMARRARETGPPLVGEGMGAVPLSAARPRNHEREVGVQRMATDAIRKTNEAVPRLGGPPLLTVWWLLCLGTQEKGAS